VQRAAEVDGEEVGDIDQRIDRPQADRGQAVLQPVRAGTVAQVADGAAETFQLGMLVGLLPLSKPPLATTTGGLLS